jgi:hypothetical protein
MAQLRTRLCALAISASLLCVAGSAGAALRDHDSTLSIQLLGLPAIVIKAKPGTKLNVAPDQSVQVPPSIFTYTGTLVPDFENLPFTFAGKGTNLDTRLLKSVQVSLRNQAGTLTQSGFIREGVIKEWGGNLPLTGFFKMKFRPYVKKVGNDLVTTTPEDKTIPAWVVGQTKGNAQAGGATPQNVGGMKYWYLGERWRAGDGSTFTGSVTFSVLNQTTPDGAEGVAFRSYVENHVQTDLYGGTRGQPFAWDNGDPDGYGTVTVVSPMAIHHQELRSDLDRARLYTVRSFARLDIEIFPTDLGLSFAPSLETGIPTIAGALGCIIFGVARRRR